MTLFPARTNRFVQRTQGLSSSLGWIGLDITSHSIRLAQVERREGRIVFTHRWVCPLSATESTAEHFAGFFQGSTSHLAKIRKMFHKSRCAATIPHSLTSMRSFELPPAPPSEMRDMVAQELAAEDERNQGDYVFGFWHRRIENAELTNISALSVPTNVATQIVKDLVTSGFDCQVLDGIPCALARAVALANDAADEPAAILDLSDTTITFVVAADGTPVFTRVLRGGGLYSLLAPLRQSLQLTHEQSMQLMSYCPLTSVDHQAETLPAVAMKLLKNPLGQLLDELARTLSYVTQQYSDVKPLRLWLVGDGTVIRCLPSYFSSALQLPVELWRLRATQRTSSDEARYGVAAALSVLRWEQFTCS